MSHARGRQLTRVALPEVCLFRLTKHHKANKLILQCICGEVVIEAPNPKITPESPLRIGAASWRAREMARKVSSSPDFTKVANDAHKIPETLTNCSKSRMNSSLSCAPVITLSTANRQNAMYASPRKIAGSPNTWPDIGREDTPGGAVRNQELVVGV